MFAPNLIADQSFVLSGRTLAELSRAEVELARLEAQLESERSKTALSKNLACLEAIATLRIDGEAPLFVDLLRISNRYEILRLENAANVEGPFGVNAFLQTCNGFKAPVHEAFRYLEAIKWIADTVDESFEITPDFLLDIHSLCIYGSPAHVSGARFRQSRHTNEKRRVLSSLHCPPDPSQVENLIVDVCRFANKNVYSPVAQAALAHFQFEEIKPFKSALDRTGRAFCHAIMHRRGFFRKAIVPIALMPAIDTRAHAIRLLPYDGGLDMDKASRACALDSWVRFCAHSSHVAAVAMRAYFDAFISLERHWRERVGRISKGSALEELLSVLMGNPLLTVSHAARLIDRGISATNDALNRLAQLGIVRCDEVVGMRNRVFIADEAIALLEEMEHRMIRQRPIAREEALRRASEGSIEH